MASFDSGFGFFNAGDMNDPRVNSLLRQKIAMSMLASKKGYPKNIGEGLTAIGDSLGDIGTMRKLSQFDLAQQDAANAGYKQEAPEAPSGSPVQPQRQSATYGQDEADEPAVTTPATASTPAPAQVAGTLLEGAAKGYSAPTMASRGAAPLTTAASQPSSMLHSNMPASLTAPTPTLRDLAPPAATAQTVAGLGEGSGAALPPSGQAVPTPGPQAAAQPPDGAAVSTRDAIATALAQKPPVMAADDAAPTIPGRTAPAMAAPATPTPAATPQTRFNASNFLPMPQQGPAAPQGGNQISAAPPIDAPIRAQGAPRAPSAIPGYVTPNPGPVPQVAAEPMTAREIQLKREIAANPGNPYFAAPRAAEIKQLEDARAFRQKQQAEQFGSNLILSRDLITQGAKDRGTATERIDKHNESLLNQNKMRYDIGKMKDEESVRRQFENMPPEVAHKTLNESKVVASAARNALVAAKNIKEQIDGGVIFGAGAPWKLSLAKAVTALGGKDMGDTIANTEAFRGQVAPLVASVLKSTVGTNQISENDRRFAENAAGGNIALDEKSVRRIIDFIGQNSRYAVDQHSKLVGGAYPPGSFGQKAYGVDISDIPKSATALLRPDIKGQDDLAAAWAAKPENRNDPRAAAIWKAQGYKTPPRLDDPKLN